ncbi:peptide deformylase [Amylolactobacillus amylotrophicus DSM 20534]|nr:peptide deformylase [Amylolactobacillus amylotrophicus DSM 20534]
MTIVILMKDIVRDGDPVLRATAQQLDFPLNDETKQLAHDMMEFLVNSQDPKIAEKHQLRAGVGLAAPQVGQSIQMAALLVPGEDDEILLQEVIVNPKITRSSVRQAALAEGEGCLSVDRDIPGYVPRADKVTVRYQNLDGEEKELKLKDYPAIVIQHEIDHLNGHLFYDHINQTEPFSLPKNTIILS